MNHMMHWKTYLAFATGSLLLLSLPPYAAGAQNTVQQTGGSAYGQPLGRSSNPLPASSGGIPGVPSSMPSQQAPGTYRLPSQDSVWGSRESSPVPTVLDAPPAWAQSALRGPASATLPPFGANLFQGNFASTYSESVNADYVILPGDRIVVRIWGAKTYDDVLMVDQQGNVFLPEVGPIRVAGLKQGQLLGAVRSSLSSVFTDNVNIYVNLQSSQPVAVYVAGFVNHPGRYAGGPMDSVMSYLDRAGGITPERGSYRHIKVMRGKSLIGTVDLYDFALRGEMPSIRLKDGDVILVDERGSSVAALGLLRQQARYEFMGTATGAHLLDLATPLNSASHVSISGIRNRAPFNVYIPIAEFAQFQLADGDTVDFVADKRGRTIMAAVTGAIQGASRFPVRKDTTLKSLLQYVEIEPAIADTSAIYIRRQSVAAQQKAIIADSLRRLEQSALTSTSSSVDEANIRVREAELIQDFVRRAATLEPDGVVVVSRGGTVKDLLLEDNDVIVIPQKTDVVHVSGEVLIPRAITYEKGMSLHEYLESAGGLSDRADKDNILVAKQNGEVGKVQNMGIAPGDRILVMPRFDSKNMQLAKDFTQILYQIAVATKVAVGL